MKKILVTGGSGLVGSNFLKILSKNKNFKLYSLYLDHPTNFKFAENIKADITNPDVINDLGKYNFDIIIHCAAAANISFCESNQDIAYDINVNGTKNVMNLAKEKDSKLIYISTDAVFDGIKGNYTEKDVPIPTTVYGKTKLAGEKCCLDDYSDKSIIVRTNVFGKNNVIDNLGFAESIINNLENGIPYTGFADVNVSPIYVADLIDMIMKVQEKNAAGIFHFAGSDSLNKYEFAKLVAEIFGYNKNLIEKGSIDSISKTIKRPKNITLNNNKLLELLDIDQTSSIRKMLLEFKKDYMEKK